jgi:hypothetical protein
MTQQPAAAPAYRSPGYWSPIRLLAIVATVACLLAGFFIAFSTNLSATTLRDWIATGIISAGVALGCMIIL